MQDFKQLLNRIAKQFRSRQAFAKAIGINASRLSRALNTGDFPFNVTNCLRLAKLSDTSPSEVLRAAGKGDVAELIESLYGRERGLSREERELIAAWHQLSPTMRDGLRTVITEVVRTTAAATILT